MVDPMYTRLDNRVGVSLGFFGIIALSIYDRILVYSLYNYFSIKVHNQVYTNLLSFLGLIIGCVAIILGFYNPILFPEGKFSVFGTMFTVGFVVFFRWAAVKSNYAFFPLDDDFYLDKNGNDIRKK